MIIIIFNNNSSNNTNNNNNKNKNILKDSFDEFHFYYSLYFNKIRVKKYKKINKYNNERKDFQKAERKQLYFN